MAQQETLNLLEDYLSSLESLEAAAKDAHGAANTFFRALTDNSILAEHDARMLVYGDYNGTLVKIERLAHKLIKKIEDV
jgi:hypothetical protein